jgi:hypothetical protein
VPYGLPPDDSAPRIVVPSVPPSPMSASVRRVGRPASPGGTVFPGSPAEGALLRPASAGPGGRRPGSASGARPLYMPPPESFVGFGLENVRAARVVSVGSHCWV